MSAVPYRVVVLESGHDRTAFDSGSDALDHYFRQQVSQDIRRRVTACFVALTPEARIAGFYTLASASLLLADLPAPLRKKLPRYPTVPAVRMGCLAVDRAYRGQGLGGALLADALARTLRAEIAAHALVVDAQDETAVAFHRHHGFLRLSDAGLMLFLPFVTARRINWRDVPAR